jgi:acyl carrier protein
MNGRELPTAEDVREFIVARLTPHLAAKGLQPGELDDSFDLLIEGVIDSFGIVELVMQLEQRFGFELDFSELDADDLTRIGPLSRYVEAQGRVGGAPAA